MSELLSFKISLNFPINIKLLFPTASLVILSNLLQMMVNPEGSLWRSFLLLFSNDFHASIPNKLAPYLTVPFIENLHFSIYWKYHFQLMTTVSISSII